MTNKVDKSGKNKTRWIIRSEERSFAKELFDRKRGKQFETRLDGVLR
jgi:hypothetical protein